jgi:hypothetical protein
MVLNAATSFFEDSNVLPMRHIRFAFRRTKVPARPSSNAGTNGMLESPRPSALASSHVWLPALASLHRLVASGFSRKKPTEPLLASSLLRE